MDPSVLLKSTWRAQWPDPVEDRKKLLTLRDLMDQRRIREQQYQMHQLAMQKSQQEMADEQRTRQILSTSQIPEHASLTDLTKLGLDFDTSVKILNNQRLLGTATATQKTAELTQQKAEADLAKRKQQDIADVYYGIRGRPVAGALGQPTLQPATDEAIMMDLLKPEGQRLGLGKIGQETPLALTEPQFQAQYSQAYTPKDTQALLKGETEAKAADLKQDEEQFKAAYPHLTGANDQDSWTAAIKTLPIRLQPLMPPRFNAANKQKALSMWVPPGEAARLATPETAGDWIRIATDPNATPEDQKRADDALSKFQAQGRANAPQMILSADQRVGNEAKLRDDYRQESKNYLTIRDAYGKIQGAAQSQTGPGDISLIYGYMKILDPGSTVREGEFATAQNAGSIPQRVQAMYNKAINGERLDPTIRNQFVEEAAKIYRQTEANQDKIRNTYGGIATRSNLDPQNVVVDYSPGIVAPGAPAAKQPAPQTSAPARRVPLSEVMPGKVAVKAPDGKTYYFPNKVEADGFKKRAGIP